MNPYIYAFRNILSVGLVFTMGVSFSTPLVVPISADLNVTPVQYNNTIMGLENSALPPDIGSVMPALPMAGDPPIAYDDSLTVLEGGTATDLDGDDIGVLDNDFEDDIYEYLTASIDTPPTNGNLTLILNGTFIYTHNGTETTTDSFIYEASDGDLTDTAMVNITIKPVNDPPMAYDDSLTVSEGGTANVLDSLHTSVLFNDLDPDSIPTVTVDIYPTYSSFFNLDSTGTFTYTHDGSENHADSFTYIASDGEYTDTAVVTISVTNQNDKPVAIPESAIVDEGGTVTVLVGGATSVLDNDSDPDSGDTLTATVDNYPEFGSLTLKTDGSFSYTHDDSENHTDSFLYVVSDGQLADFADVTITINPVNDPPSVMEDSFIALEDTKLSVEAPGVLANDSDAEGDPLSASLFPESTHDELTLNLDGSFSYIPPQDFIGNVQFFYRASDSVDYSNIVTLTINVLDVDEEPPFISWVSPAIGEDNWIDIGTQIIPLEVEVVDNVEVAEVNFRRWEPSIQEWVDIGSVSSAPFRFYLDTSTLNIGFNQVTAEAIDTTGNHSEVYIFLRRWGGLVYLPVVFR